MQKPHLSQPPVDIDDFFAMPSPSERDHLAAQFRRQHSVVLPRLLGPKLVDELATYYDDRQFFPVSHPSGSLDLIPQPNPVSGLLNLMLSHPTVTALIRDICGFESEITRFRGRVYRMTPSSGQDEWHHDLTPRDTPPRLAAMSLNLSSRSYSRGRLQLRLRGSSSLMADIGDLPFGGALLFRVHPELEHRNTRVEDGIKTACAGWFMAPTTARSLEYQSLGGAEAQTPC